MRIWVAALAVWVTASVASGCAAANSSATRGIYAPTEFDKPFSSIEQTDSVLRHALQQLRARPAAETHNAAAERYRVLGVFDVAVRHFAAALQFNRRDAAAHDGLARVWRDWGMPDVALGHAMRGVFHAPRSAAVQNTLGTIFQALGRHADARRAYQRAASLDPAAAYAKSNLCYLSFLEGQLDAATVLCDAAIQAEPKSRSARNNLALVQAAAGDLATARETFAAAGEEAVAAFNMGIVHLARREYREAADAFDRASREDPSFATARERAVQARWLAIEVRRSFPGGSK